MASIFCKTGHPPCTVGWIGHLQVSWETLNPRHQPVRDVYITLYTKPGAKASNFFDSPDLVRALDDNLHLASIWLRANDITTSYWPKDIVADTLKIKYAFKECGMAIKIITIENRMYTLGHPHYVPADIYRASRNSINWVATGKKNAKGRFY